LLFRRRTDEAGRVLVPNSSEVVPSSGESLDLCLFLGRDEAGRDPVVPPFFFLGPPVAMIVSAGKSPRSTDMARAFGIESHDLPLFGAVHFLLLRFCLLQKIVKT
jgi:hypothetical protein